MYDITGRDPNEIFTNNSLVVTGNWAGTYGPTGASASGVPGIQCASDPTAGANTFATMPNLVQGHEYLYSSVILPIHKVVIIYLLVVALQ